MAASVFVESSFSVTYETDEAGLVTITTHGTAQIPMSLRADNTIERNVDDEIAKVIKPVPTGFLRRMSGQISADRTTCTFTITDRQIEVPYPDDVVDIQMRHRVKQQKPYSPVWECSISGTVRLSPTADRFLAWKRFFNIAAQRMSFTSNHVAVQSQQSHTVANTPTRLWKARLFVGTTEFNENLFQNSSSFVINYRIIGAPIDVILRVSGLWRKIVDNNDNLPPDGTTWTPFSWAAA